MGVELGRLLHNEQVDVMFLSGESRAEELLSFPVATEVFVGTRTLNFVSEYTRRSILSSSYADRTSISSRTDFL